MFMASMSIAMTSVISASIMIRTTNTYVVTAVAVATVVVVVTIVTIILASVVVRPVTDRAVMSLTAVFAWVSSQLIEAYLGPLNIRGFCSHGSVVRLYTCSSSW